MLHRTIAVAAGSTTSAAMSFTARRKIQKEKGQEPDEFEESVAQALFDLESTSSELKSELRDLFINSAKEVDVSGNRKAVIIHVPYRLRKAFQKIHARLVRELEKKFSGKVGAGFRIVVSGWIDLVFKQPSSGLLSSLFPAVVQRCTHLGVSLKCSFVKLGFCYNITRKNPPCYFCRMLLSSPPGVS